MCGEKKGYGKKKEMKKTLKAISLKGRESVFKM